MRLTDRQTDRQNSHRIACSALKYNVTKKQEICGMQIYTPHVQYINNQYNDYMQCIHRLKIRITLRLITDVNASSVVSITHLSSNAVCKFEIKLVNSCMGSIQKASYI